MPPKFQSTFIPRGQMASTSSGIAQVERRASRTFLSTIAFFIFSASVIFALGVFGYRLYLEYSIDQMSGALEEARAALDPEAISELTELHRRIVSTRSLVDSHRVVTPLFTLLEDAAPRTVRFTSFKFSHEEGKLVLDLTGEARGYSALALQADIFNKSRYFRNPVFSDLNLNDKGDVKFSFKGLLEPGLVSYSGSVSTETFESELELATSTQSNLPQI